MRDGYKCRASGSDDRMRLNLAYFTPTTSFVKVFSQSLGLDFAIGSSFRDDNLVTLCGSCHRLQHGEIDSAYSPEISKKQDRLHQIVENGSAKDYLQLKREIDELFIRARREGSLRKKNVENLFECIKNKRGWDNAGQLEIKTGNQGSEVGVKEKFAALARGCHIPTGKHIIPSKEGKECGYLASTCTGVLTKCKKCGFWFCQYHFETHLIDPNLDRF